MAVFVCTVDSRPLAQLALFHGERLLATSPGPQLPRHGRLQAKATANSLQLEVRDLGLGDSGSYRCEATNDLGSANTSLFFQVRGECLSSEDVVDPAAPGATPCRLWSGLCGFCAEMCIFFQSWLGHSFQPASRRPPFVSSWIFSSVITTAASRSIYI